jgi:hypothetical protein
MSTPWENPISRREEGNDLDVLSYASQFLDGQQVFRNQQTAWHQLPWLDVSQGASPETTTTIETSNADYIHGGCFELPFHPATCDESSCNFGLDSKTPFSPHQPEISISDYDHWDLPAGNFINARTDTSQQKYPSDLYSSSKSSGTSTESEFTPPTTGPLLSSQQFLNQSLALQYEQISWSNVFLDSMFPVGAAEQACSTQFDHSPRLEHKFSPILFSLDSTDQIVASATPEAGGNYRPPDTRQVSLGNSTASTSDSRRSVSATAAPLNHRTEESPAPSKRPASFDDCVNIFETTPGAMTKLKRRKKLDPKSHKSFRATRKIGACLECRFRKRPVSAA